MVGESPQMRRAFRLLRRYAVTSAPVLIQGESGTGKELAARAIHERSQYAAKPFVPVNCGALPPELIASELFGHEKGAFTGAHQRRKGRIEAAAGGTLFLDEIGDLPLDLQPHLLRFLQEGTIERLGTALPIHVDVRVVAATNVPLWKKVQKKEFREDLFYRLHVLTLTLPPLREREGDVEILVGFFLHRLAREMGFPCPRLTPDAMAALRSHGWPGNIRELISVLRRTIVMAESIEITAAELDLRPDLRADADGALIGTPRGLDGGCETSGPAAGEPDRPLSLREARNRAERQVMRTALTRNRQNILKTARELGISRVTLYRLLEKHGISAEKTAQGAERPFA
ncbi:MAG: sigma-54 dependent transcriptional regulator [Marinovum algicola]|uniref:sigma-54 interaction domain-containing protein n=1 Tax=Marinovum algicola TaxID=42444 RepID=UPI0032F054F3